MYWARQQTRARPVNLDKYRNMPDHVREALKKEQAIKEGQDFEVEEENWQAYELFCHIDHLWRYGAMGGVLGLDWTQIDSWLNRTEYPAKPADFKAVYYIEQAAIGILNERHK